ncbi:MAG: mechanosensitive ion channel [Caldilineaceae bacterium]
MRRTLIWLFMIVTVPLILGSIGAAAPVWAQDEAPDSGVDTLLAEETPAAPERVEIDPTAADEEIAQRLTAILVSTGWFQAPEVVVREGVAFLNGRTAREEYKSWAGELASRTQDVVAVVNRIEVVVRSPWDFTPAWTELRTLGRSILQALPLILFALVILWLAWWLARATSRLAGRLLQRRIPNQFLRSLSAVALSIPVFLIGLYLVLQVAGLTRLAVTVLGGTGLAGLVIGIAFRDIIENFLASILISTRSPFRVGDRIEVAGFLGLVQQVTTRGTVLMSLDGSLIRIPNATVYKSNIINYTANPYRRLDFTVGISYDDSIAAAQELLIKVLADHPAVLDQPEALVLVHNFGAATVDLRVFFWFDSQAHADIKIKSSVMRLVKQALMEQGFTLPDAAREVIFPKGIPVTLAEMPAEITGERRKMRPASPTTGKAAGKMTEKPTPIEPTPLSTPAEGGLGSEDEQIQEQAQQARKLEDGENLLKAEPA